MTPIVHPPTQLMVVTESRPWQTSCRAPTANVTVRPLIVEPVCTRGLRRPCEPCNLICLRQFLWKILLSMVQFENVRHGILALRHTKKIPSRVTSLRGTFRGCVACVSPVLASRTRGEGGGGHGEAAGSGGPDSEGPPTRSAFMSVRRRLITGTGEVAATWGVHPRDLTAYAPAPAAAFCDILMIVAV